MKMNEEIKIRKLTDAERRGTKPFYKQNLKIASFLVI